MIKFKQYIQEGGNVFTGKTAGIKLEYIKPTMDAYFAELKQLFPKKASIFNANHFKPLGSVGKKPISGDIDLAIDSKSLLDKNFSDASIEEWGIDPKAVQQEYAKLAQRAKTSTPEQIAMKAFLKLLVLHINSHAPTLYCDEKKITNGNIFGLYPQINTKGEHVGIGVQIDWMVGDIDWLTFSYHSSAYPEGSNVKGLHRTQLMLSAFNQAGLSFNHVSGVKDMDTGKVIATDPTSAIKELNKRLGTHFNADSVDDYYKLRAALKKHASDEDYSKILDTYFKILDSTRADIPDDLQSEWKKRQHRLGLTGKFLPDDSHLKESINMKTFAKSIDEALGVHDKSRDAHVGWDEDIDKPRKQPKPDTRTPEEKEAMHGSVDSMSIGKKSWMKPRTVTKANEAFEPKVEYKPKVGDDVRIPTHTLGGTEGGKVVRLGRSGLVHVATKDDVHALPPKHVFKSDMSCKNYHDYSWGPNKMHESIDEHIVSIGGGKHRLLSHTGKNLGTFDSKEAAEKHEREVNYFKSQAESVHDYSPSNFFPRNSVKIKPKKEEPKRTSYTDDELKQLGNELGKTKAKLMEFLEGEENPSKKYPRAMFPAKKAENMKRMARDRLDRYKDKKWKNKHPVDLNTRIHGPSFGGLNF